MNRISFFLTVLVLSFAFTLSGCTDVGYQKITNFNQAFHIKCFSGGQLTYDGHSTGRLQSEDGSDGWAFVDAATKKFTLVSGDCVIVED